MPLYNCIICGLPPAKYRKSMCPATDEPHYDTPVGEVCKDCEEVVTGYWKRTKCKGALRHELRYKCETCGIRTDFFGMVSEECTGSLTGHQLPYHTNRNVRLMPVPKTTVEGQREIEELLSRLPYRGSRALRLHLKAEKKLGKIRVQPGYGK